MSNPRAHHYCPESYLGGFTDNETRDGTLWTFDRFKQQVRKSKPKNEAHQRDFYRLDLDDGSDPFVLEKAFSSIESGAKTAIKHITTYLTLPEKEPLEFLIGFIGLLTVRTPAFRKKIGGFNEQVAKMVMDLTCADEKRFEVTKRHLSESGRDVPDDVSFEEMREYIESDEYTVETHQNEHLTTMLTLASTVTDLLLRRSWVIVVAEGGDFVCSDNPVGLAWSKTLEGPWHSPGFGLIGTEVSFPVSKDIALIGTFEPLPLDIGGLNEFGVANFNNKAIARSERFIYASKDNFIWCNHEGKILGAQEYFATHGKTPCS